jgi:hypothetical protein
MTVLRRVDGEWRVRLMHAFQVHVRAERHVLDDYTHLMERTTDPGVRFLIEQILSDERRHHELFIALANDSWASSNGGASMIPVPHPTPSEAAELLEATSTFLAIERDDREQLRWLRREVAAAGSESLWPVVLEVMETDTAKHIRLLHELRTRLRHAAARNGETEEETT